MCLLERLFERVGGGGTAKTIFCIKTIDGNFVLQNALDESPKTFNPWKIANDYKNVIYLFHSPPQT